MPLKIVHGNCENCTNPFCSSLSYEARSEIAKSGRWVKYPYKKLQFLFFGDTMVYIIEKGAVLTIREDQRGNRAGIEILNDGDVIGIVQLYNSNYQSSISILPLTDVCGCLVPVHSIQNVINSHPGIAPEIISHYSKRYAQLIAHSVIRQSGNMEEKIDYIFSIIREKEITQITQDEIALFLGINRVTVSRALRKIKIEI